MENGDLHDANREHGDQSKSLTKRDLYRHKLRRRQHENEEVTQRVLSAIEVINSFDVEAFSCEEVFENLPVRCCRSVWI
jgi:hypothetical protein